MWDSDDSEYEPAIETEKDSTPIKFGPKPELYHTSAFLLFSNIQRLAISTMPRISRSYSLLTGKYKIPWSVGRSNGRNYLRQLEELKL
jgi:hypothetical protein